MVRKEFERVTPESVGIPSEAVLRLLEAVDSGYGEMHGLMIMRHGKVCAEGWWAPYAPGMHHMCASLTKTYMGTAIAIAIRDGLLTLDTHLNEIFPEFVPEEKSQYFDELTVRSVLCMGTGMKVFPTMKGNWVQNYIAVPLVHRPMTDFHYNSVGSTFLGKIIEKLTGMNVYEYLAEKLFPYIGIDPENLDHGVAPAGQDMWAWRTISTTEDNLRLMKLYLDGGKVGDLQLLPPEYVALATTKQIENAGPDAEGREKTDGEMGYGFQMWMCRYPGAYRADGAQGQYSIVVPSLDMVISMNENTDDAWITLDHVWNILLPAVCEEALPENEEAQKRLAGKLRHLCIESPVHAPYSDLKEAASGRYLVKENTFHPYCVGMFAPECEPALSFEITFGVMEGKLRWTSVDRMVCEVEFALDGSRRYNRFASPWQFATICYANGYFEAPERFVLEMLWPENNSRKKLVFTFGEAGCDVSYLSGGLPGQPVVETVCRCEKK